jgi:hypothetical protein
MLASEIVALVEELESLGIRFTVVPRLDGSLRLNCWRLHNSWQHRDRVNRLIAERIENVPDSAAQIAEFIKARSSAIEPSVDRTNADSE